METSNLDSYRSRKSPYNSGKEDATTDWSLQERLISKQLAVIGSGSDHK